MLMGPDASLAPPVGCSAFSVFLCNHPFLNHFLFICSFYSGFLFLTTIRLPVLWQKSLLMSTCSMTDNLFVLDPLYIFTPQTLLIYCCHGVWPSVPHRSLSWLNLIGPLFPLSILDPGCSSSLTQCPVTNHRRP